MKMKNLFPIIFICCLFLVTACEEKLDIPQQGVVAIDNFYETDEDAEEAITAVYLQWRSMIGSDFFLLNGLSDEIHSGGGARGDNPFLEQLCEYSFSSANSWVNDYFRGLYTMIYRCNLVTERIESDTDVKARVIAEAKVARAWAYSKLVTLWGKVPLVTTELAPSEYQQPNAEISAVWAQIEKDFTEAISSGALSEKSSPDDKSIGAKITKQAAQAFLGKAQLFQEKHSEAATTLKAVINSENYRLIADYENVLRAVQDFGPENIFEVNSLPDPDNPWEQGTSWFSPAFGWNSSLMDLSTGYNEGHHDLIPTGWGFCNPTKELYDAFVAMEGADGYRLNATIKTYEQVMAISPEAPITIRPGSKLYGHEGYFNWKLRYLGSEVIPNTWGFAGSNNYRFMRYAEVLLLASEACLLSGDKASALNYINQIRERAQLPNLANVTLDDIKNEKRLELCLEQVRFEDLVRWGDAGNVLAGRGAKIPTFAGLKDDGTYEVTYPFENTNYGFKPGKNELLPFPEHEMNVNKNLIQNTGY
ncbi:RagB/SusD family nutrient uptake outer membrane protein [Gaoshiqia sediminis]|uniref:RagB/SusD family nutrient uptake outer membrane protein n=1 Tax=Gaoshiqia sediminis TaxID=2986998 RepID=A0AA41YCP5_9BACT|nr:RagB/SusD family nutrient uptake outer membrane protein [Gaoshiqia sediminis]MCW0483970.1 RagB/SusD family nutrient uptake outer membrane protein [Gaoshiqia sediminis]